MESGFELFSPIHNNSDTDCLDNVHVDRPLGHSHSEGDKQNEPNLGKLGVTNPDGGMLQASDARGNHVEEDSLRLCTPL